MPRYRKNYRRNRIIVISTIVIIAIAGFLIYYVISEPSPSTTSISASSSPTQLNISSPINFNVTITSIPTLAMTNEPIPITWQIDGSGTTFHTALHYDSIGRKNPAGASDYAYASTYFCTSKSCNLPNNFSDAVVINAPGTYFLRAHLVVDGKNYWSDEKTIVISQNQNMNSTRGKTGNRYEDVTFGENIIHFSDSFDPYLMNVTENSTAIWINDADRIHTITFENGFNSGLIPANGGYFSYTFNTAGIYIYHDSVNPAIHGQITVEKST